MIASNPSVGQEGNLRSATEIGLEQVRAGTRFIVAGIVASWSEAKRLADMGFFPGVRAEMVRSGDPCIVRLHGTLVGLGGANQRVVRVVPCE